MGKGARRDRKARRKADKLARAQANGSDQPAESSPEPAPQAGNGGYAASTSIQAPADARLVGRAVREQWATPPAKAAGIVGLFADAALDVGIGLHDRAMCAAVVMKAEELNLKYRKDRREKMLAKIKAAKELAGTGQGEREFRWIPPEQRAAELLANTMAVVADHEAE